MPARLTAYGYHVAGQGRAFGVLSEPRYDLPTPVRAVEDD